LISGPVRTADRSANASMQTLQRTASIVMYGTIVIVTLLVAVIGFVVGRGVSGPILGMTDAMTKLAGGDKTIAIPGVGRRDAIGTMAAAVQIFKDNMIRADQLAAEQRSSQERREKRAQKMEASIKSFDESVTGLLRALADSSSQLQSTAQAMS